MKEYHLSMADGTQVTAHFQAYDTCISTTNCPIQNVDVGMDRCWQACLDIEGAGGKVTKRKL